MAAKLKQADYERQNESAARIILADPGRYGGSEAGLVRWAAIVLEGKSKISVDTPQKQP